MLDLETGGLSPDHSPILQIAAVKFDLGSRRVNSDNMFDRCLHMAPNRFWDEGTRDWWASQNQDTYRGIISRAEDPATVLWDLVTWVVSDTLNDQPLVFWSKPSTFDYPLITSYFRQYGLQNPWHYRQVIDMNSFIRGMAGRTDCELNYTPFIGPAHNALVDVLNQINNLFAACDHHGK